MEVMIQESWEVLELGCRKVYDRKNRMIHTENPVHEEDTVQELGSGDGENCSSGLHLLPCCLFAVWLILGSGDGENYNSGLNLPHFGS